MPGQNGGWLDHCQIVPAAVLEAGEQHPEDTVNGPKPGARSSMNEARELVTQGDSLGDEICTVLEDGSDNGENQRELEGHLADHSLGPTERRRAENPRLYAILTRHNLQMVLVGRGRIG
jgi:hypothetical protein